MSTPGFSLGRRSAGFYWRSHLTVVLGVAAAGAALTGALMVGDSMRASLREVAIGRLGDVTHALRAPRFFREELAWALPTEARGKRVAPIIEMRGGVTHADSGARVEHINVLGVDERFWSLSRVQTAADPDPTMDIGRDVIVNEPLARELGVSAGEDVLLRVGQVQDISPEMLLGRRDDGVLTRRVTVRSVIPALAMGRFGLEHGQATPRNLYMSLSSLQRLQDKRDQANTLLVAQPTTDAATADDHEWPTDWLQQRLDAVMQPGDLGLSLRTAEARGYIALESDNFLLSPAVEQAARDAAVANNVKTGSVITYLANGIVAEAAGTDRAEPRQIPYSVVAALDGEAAQRLVAGTLEPPSTGQILLNDWAAEDLSASVGDTVRLDYYMTGAFGQLEERSETFQVAGIVPLSGAAADPGYTPDYAGVTDTANIADWDPPFPVDLNRVEQKDEDYWDEHRATPKAFVNFDDAVRLWSEDAERFGRLTALRFYPQQSLDGVAPSITAALLERLGGQGGGMVFEPVREAALQAGSGSTDFGGLFIGFSFFLIVSAGMLVALLFRLGVERRSSEIGILLAIGFAPRRVARILLNEGLWLSAVGAVIGLAASSGYAWLMLAGLRTWWSEAARAPFVRLHVSPLSLGIGFFATVVVALFSVWFAIRGLGALAPRTLMAGGAGDVAAVVACPTRHRRRNRIAAVLTVLALGLAAWPLVSDGGSQQLGFFGSGALLLTAVLLFVRSCFDRPARGLLHQPGAWTTMRLGFRNAPRHPGRSALTVALIASATFIIAALQAFRLDPAADTGRTGGSGGYAWVAESAVPLLFDLGAAQGRQALDLAEDAEAVLGPTAVMPFRLRPGDNASCTNLYLPTRHRIVGATPAFVERGGFQFLGVDSDDAAVRDNPWLALGRPLDDGAIAVIGDESAVRWQLHSGLGKDLVIADERGTPRTLRFVALLKGSVLQDELIIAESDFTKLFPRRSGYSFFLIDSAASPESSVGTWLERELSDYGFDAFSSADRLADYFAVQNTYLSLFQTLGGLGLILGTLGLTAVLLRNVWERRGELALMRAVGFARGSLGWMVLSENGLLVGMGLLGGVLPAAVAVAPYLLDRPQDLPLGSLALILLSVFLIGMLSGAFALRPTLRAPLVPALRRE